MSATYEIPRFEKDQLDAKLGKASDSRKQENDTAAEHLRAHRDVKKARQEENNLAREVSEQGKKVTTQEKLITSLDAQKGISIKKKAAFVNQLAEARSHLERAKKPEGFRVVGDETSTASKESKNTGALETKIATLTINIQNEDKKLAILENKLTAARNILTQLRTEEKKLVNRREEKHAGAEILTSRAEQLNAKNRVSVKKNQENQERITQFAEYVAKEAKPVEVVQGDTGQGNKKAA